MTHIVIVSHGELGKALIDSAEMIAGPLEDVTALSLLPGENLDSFGEKLGAFFDALGDQDVLVLIDLFGGTPYNVAARQVMRPNVECVTGANLPMLLELALTCRAQAESLAELAAMATEAGMASVKNLGPMLGV
ncbi:MAG: PTS sugar transporter subunit IIA [Anaerolineae bacterium]|nr:PTS sugar transporter subunit IIA [Anaerolineae bacterium]